MKFKKTLTAAAAAATLLVGGAGAASAASYGYHHCSSHDRDCDGRRDNSKAERFDRDGYHDNRRYDAMMDRRDYRRMIKRERLFEIVRAHHYRYIGEPYWYRGVYGVRAYDPYGRIVFVRIDPYSGAWGGIYIRL